MAIKVFIVDDHYLVIEGIRSLLQDEKQIEWMGHAMNGESCLAFLARQQPDIILMDISLPGTNGIELCKEVKARFPSVFIIGLSTFNQQSFIQKMMDNGASGYVLKNVSQQELVTAIETVVKGKLYLSDEAASVLRSREGEKVPVLTRRELEVLDLIANGFTNHEIADRLFVSITTVETHRKNLLTKFEAKNVAAMVRMATQMKIV